MSAPVQPSQTFEVVLAQHEKKQSASNGKKGKVPTFTFRLMSMREAMDLEDSFVEADESGGAAREFVPRMCGAIRRILVGWKNQKDFNGNPVPYDPSKLEDVCDMADLLELRGRVVTDATVKALDLKGLGSQSRSDVEPSAHPAGRAIAQAVEEKGGRLGSNAQGVTGTDLGASSATTAGGTRL